MRTPDSIVNNRRHFWLAVLATLAAIVFAHPTLAQPVKLKFSFFTSDRSLIYQTTVKPFVDAVNAEGQGVVEIEVYFSGAISANQSEQPQLVEDGVADLAIAVPGYSSDRFPDAAVMELPGLFQDEREASRVFSRLIAADALAGFRDFYVVGAFVSAGESIHSRTPVGSLDRLKGLTIRTNNQIEAQTLEGLGAIPVLLPINRTLEALSEGRINGAVSPPSMLFEFGAGRVTSHHYMLQIGGAPTAIIMNRNKFASLPLQAQEIIRKYSGDWLIDRAAAALEVKNREVLAALEADPKRKVVFPSRDDLAAAQRTFSSVVADWSNVNPHNRELLRRVETEIRKIRSDN